ncbi:ABC transporter substrate binding protein [Labilibacter marinus]|uniref:ABC transporter substrate binding protein n=1 Tax=Labilibacter marinus TaxID=1477105 RepID=UPI00094FE521|nr:ABC transporter substrate binding protein [Labilibacter marinus]
MNYKVVLIIVFQLLIGGELFAEKGKRILLVSSYNSSYPTYFDQINGVKSILDEAGVAIDVESYDSKRFRQKEYRDIFYDLIEYKINQGIKYDAILACDDNALKFVNEHQLNLFKNLPIVFCGINDIELAINQNNNRWITGVVEEVSVKDNICLMKQMFPNAKRLNILSDNTTTGVAIQSQIRQNMKRSDIVELNFISLDTLSFEEWEVQLSLLEKEEPSLLVSALRDRNSKSLDFDRSLALLKRKASTPLFHLWHHGLGNGILGGKLVSLFEQGKYAALVIKEIIAGKDVAEIKVQTLSPNFYEFDYNELVKYEVDIDKLPKNSKIINKPISIISQNKKAILGIVIFMLIQAVLIIYLLRNIRKRKKAKNELEYSNGELNEKNNQLLAAEEELRANIEELASKRNELETSEERFRLAILGSNDGVWDWNLINNQVYLSPRWKSIIGYLDNELVNELSTWQDLVFEEDYPEALAQVSGFIEGSSETYEVRFRMKHKDGHLVPVLARGYMMRNSQGKAYRIIGTHQDLTSSYEYEQKLKEQLEENLSLYEEYRTISEELHVKNDDLSAAEEELRANNEELFHTNKNLIESEGRYRLLFNNLNEGFALHEIVVDENNIPVDYIFRDVNPVFLSRIGMEYEDIIDKSAKELFPNTEIEWIDRFGEVALTGNSDRFINYASTINKYYETHVFSPKKGFFAAIFNDITNRKEAELALKGSEERFKKIFDSSKTVMLIIDPETASVIDSNVSACAYYGYSKEELNQMPLKNINLLSVDKIKEKVGLSLSKGRTYYRFEHILKSGEIRNVDVYTSPIEMEDRKLLHSIVIDVTESVEADLQLKKINQRFQGLDNIVHYQAKSINDLMNFTLKEIIKYTHSDTGAVYEYDDRKGIFILNDWSEAVHLTHEAVADGALEKLDCLSRAVITKEVVIVNNPSKKYSFQKGDILQGDLMKSITIPVLDNGAVVALFWLAGKNRLYSKFHAEQIKLLLDTAWILVEKQRMQDTKN